MTNKSIRDYINLIEAAQQGVAEAGNGRPGTTPGFKDTLASDEKRRAQRSAERSAEYKSTKAGIDKSRAKADAYRKSGEQGVAEGSLNEFAPDGFNGGDDGDEFSPEIAKMAQEDGFTKGVGLADGATLERAITINHWHSQHGGMYKQYFAKGFIAGRKEKIRHDNKQYSLNLKLMKDGSIRHGEQGVAEGAGFDKWADERAASQLHKLKKPHPETWHDVDKKLGKATDKMSQAEKVKKGVAHPDTLTNKK